MLFCYCKRVFLPESSWRGRLAVVEGLLSCFLMCCKWGQIVKCLSTGWTLVFPLSRSSLVDLFLVAFLIQIAMERLVALITLIWFLVDMCFSWRFNLSGRVKTFPQISHTWRDLLVEEISSSSFRDTVRQVLFASSGSKLRQQLNKAFHLHGFIILLFIP